MVTGATRPVSLWAPVAVLMGAIFWLSAQPHLPVPPGALSDKHVHAITYGALAALWLRALAGGRSAGVTLRRVAWAVAAAASYGVSDEWHQAFVPGRTAEWADLGADVAGAATAAGAIWAWGIIHARRHQGAPVSRAGVAAHRRR